MDIGASTMTTLIDDGLVESCLDEPVAVIDLDELTVIDIDDIDATIEDPGYILDEDVDTSNRNEVHKPSDKKRSFALPVTFFDINSNINLLKKCRPISIKIVDCSIYPWYYRKNKHTAYSSGTVNNRDEDLDQRMHRNDSIDLIDLTSCDTYVNDEVISTPSVNLPIINLSPEQRSVVLKLKEEIKNQDSLNEVYENTIDGIHKETVLSKKHEDLTKVNLTPLEANASECSLKKTIEHHDLLTYKEIAQTIVRNIEHNAVSNKTDNIYVDSQNTNTNNISEHNISINFKDSVKNLPLHNKEERKKMSTSPILPYTIKRQKRTNSKEKVLPTPPKVNSSMERCTEFSKNCNTFMSSVNQIIPHYHSKLPAQANNNNNNVYTSHRVANELHFQQPISKSSPLHCYQQFNKKELCNNSDSILAYNSKGEFVTNTYNGAYVSYLDLGKKICNSPVLNSCEITNEFNIQNGNGLRFVRRSAKQLSNENCGIIPQTAIPTNIFYGNDIQNFTCLQNNNVNYSSMRVSMQNEVSNVNNTIQRNPLLRQILNTNDIREPYQSVQVHSGLNPKPVMTSTSYPSMAQNIRLPPRPPLPTPNLEPYCPSTQYTQHENVQYSNTGTLLQGFQNIENTELFRDKANSGLKKIRSILNNPRKDYNNLKCIPIAPPHVTVSMPPRVDPVKPNIYPQNEMQSTSKASSAFSGDIDPKMLINTNSKINQHNNKKDPVKPKIIKDVKKTKTNNLDAMINVLSIKKSDSTVHKCSAQQKKMIIKEKIMNPAKPYNILELNQLDTNSKIDGVSKTFYTIVHPAKLKDINTPEKVEIKINGYSPPILPIPSFKKSLEMFSGINSRQFAPNNYFEGDTNKTSLDISKDRRKTQDFTNTPRKRKLFVDEKVYGNSKRISLQEYKLRKSENMNNM